MAGHSHGHWVPNAEVNYLITRSRETTRDSETFRVDATNRDRQPDTVVSLVRIDGDLGRTGNSVTPCDPSRKKRQRRGVMPRRYPLTGGPRLLEAQIQVAGAGFEPATSGL